MRHPQRLISRSLFETTGDALEAVLRLLPQPLHHARDVVAIRDVIAESGKAVRLAAVFHFGKLLRVELLFADAAPIVFRVVHRETRRDRAIGADDQPVLSRAAAPMFADAAHKSLHIL